VLLNPFQTNLYRQLSSYGQHLDQALAGVLDRYSDHSSLYSDLLYVLGNIKVSNEEARYYFGRLESHRKMMEAALDHPVDFRVALMDFFFHIQPRYESPKIIEFKDYEENLAAAMQDELTGLMNRRSMEALLASELARASRHNDSLSLLFIDIDDFKQVNDLHGHPVGDQVLACMGNFLRAQLRSEDISARWGGEEFLVALPSTDQTGVNKLARRLLRNLKVFSFPKNLKITISAGISQYPQDGKCLETLLVSADERMYFAKRGGKNRICLGPELDLSPE